MELKQVIHASTVLLKLHGKVKIFQSLKNLKATVSWWLPEAHGNPMKNCWLNTSIVIRKQNSLLHHETKKGNIERLISLLESPKICYSESTEESVIDKQVLIIDTIGLLSSIYKYADLAYIGGGFGVGIHNTLEAAIFGMPLIFGPNYLKFHEATSMVELGIAFPVSDFSSFQSILNQLLNDTEKKDLISGKCITFTRQNIGATQIVLDKVFNKH